MNANENTRTNPQEDVVVLGTASVETKGAGEPGNEILGFVTGVGIAE
ncbi:benenodin family lasso peptide [[Pseudomonas] boreopolis]|uniref:Benenodin family lasso peptide n=1 Tax=Xanthomonas boreopolis TaxID=86183 RepID=A0A919KI30_9XANT|nr:hypothetical protein GCM10009090_15360 [[Pseudomonas] boreopolis]